MSQNRQAATGHDDAYGFLLIPAALVIICWLWFSKFVWASCLLLYWLWGMVDFQRIHPGSRKKLTCWPVPAITPVQSPGMTGSP